MSVPPLLDTNYNSIDVTNNDLQNGKFRSKMRKSSQASYEIPSLPNITRSINMISSDLTGLNFESYQTGDNVPNYSNEKVRFIPQKDKFNLSLYEKDKIKRKVQTTFLKPMKKTTADFEDFKVQLKA